MDSLLAIILTVIISLTLCLIAPILTYYTYNYWQNKVNDAETIRLKQQRTLSVLLSFVMIINSIFSLPLLTLIYLYYFEYDLNKTLYASLYPFIICLFSLISLEALLYNIRLFNIYYEWRLNVDILSLKLNNCYLFNPREYNPLKRNNKKSKIKKKLQKMKILSPNSGSSDCDYKMNDCEVLCESPSSSTSLPWTIKYQSIFGNLQLMVLIVVLLWITSTLCLWIFVVYCLMLFSFTMILTLFVLQFNDTLDIHSELVSITSLIVIFVILYALMNILTDWTSLWRVFFVFFLMESIQILIIFRVICGAIPCIDNIHNNVVFDTFGGSFIGDTININQIFADENGYESFAQYLISELNVSQLLYLTDFIHLQNYIMNNEWIKDEFITNLDASYIDDDIDDHNTVGECINDLQYIYHRYLAAYSIANIYISVDDIGNIKLLIDEFVNNNDLNNKNELQILKALYVQYENIALKIYTNLSEQSINRFQRSIQYKNWKSSSYKTFL